MQLQTRAFRAPDELWTATVAAAEQTGVNTSEILRRALADYEPVKLAFCPNGRAAKHGTGLED